MTTYSTIYRCKGLFFNCKTIEECITVLKQQLEMFEDWQKRGVKLDPDSDVDNDYASFTTTLKKIADQYEFECKTGLRNPTFIGRC